MKRVPNGTGPPVLPFLNRYKMPGEHCEDLVVSYTIVNALMLTISSTLRFDPVFLNHK